MKSLRTSLVIGMAVLGLGSAAVHAQDNQGRHGHQLTQEQIAAKQAEHKAKFQEMVAKRQAALHDKLKLTAAQEPAWTAFVAATTPQFPAMPDHGAAASMTAPERMEKHLEMAKQHLATQETRLAAVKTFYAVLTADQQKIFDQAAKEHHARMKRGMMGMMHHG